MNCKYCKSEDVISYGTTLAGTPRYMCRSCDRSFTGTRPGRPRKVNPDPAPPHPAIGAAQRLADRFGGQMTIAENTITVTIAIDS